MPAQHAFGHLQTQLAVALLDLLALDTSDRRSRVLPLRGWHRSGCRSGASAGAVDEARQLAEAKARRLGRNRRRCCASPGAATSNRSRLNLCPDAVEDGGRLDLMRGALQSDVSIKDWLAGPHVLTW